MLLAVMIVVSGDDCGVIGAGEEPAGKIVSLHGDIPSVRPRSRPGYSGGRIGLSDVLIRAGRPTLRAWASRRYRVATCSHRSVMGVPEPKRSAQGLAGLTCPRGPVRCGRLDQ